MPVKGINCPESDGSQEKFAVPHPLKHANTSRLTPKKTPLSRSKSIPGLSSSGTTKASPVTPRGGTPKNNKLSTGGRCLSSTKLTDSGTPVTKHNHNAETHFHRVQTSASSAQNLTPVKRGTIQKHSACSTAEKIPPQRETTSLPATPECFDVVHLETPRKTMDELTCPDWLAQVGETSTEGETSNLTVGVRVRPLNAREAADSSVKTVISMKENEVTVDMCNETGMSHVFTYDHCFWSASTIENQGMPHSSQEYVYNKLVHPLLDKAFEGYNACLFAYGQTGSGKSYSMMGSGMDQIVDQPEAEAGIIPRFCHKVFERIAQLDCSDISISDSSENRHISNISVEISYFEIYNEKIHDLLGDSDVTRSRRAPLRVREHPVFGPHVVDLSTYVVVSYKDLQEWIMVGNSRRATAATEMNEKSSRSHSIFSVMLTQTEGENIGKENVGRRSKIHLVDLAGSERLSQTCASGDRLREGVSINRSLLTLGKVIAALAEGNCNSSAKKKTFIPYRDSVLTWLLRESLGGNSRTAMLATVSPASIHAEETLSTLRYATQAGTIVNRVRINEGSNDRLIRELRAEIDRLRALRLDYESQKRIAPRRIIPFEVATSEGNNHAASKEARAKEMEIEDLRQRLKLSEEQLKRAETTWSERIAEAEKCKNAEIAYLRRRGLAVCLNNGDGNTSKGSPSKQSMKLMACLINLSADPGFSGTLLYLLPPGNVQIGRVPNRTEPSDGEMADILLDGPLVAVKHCTIENNAGKLTLHTSSSSANDTYVNGYSVVRDGCHPLKHGDRLVIGGNHFFMVNNPSDLPDNFNSQFNSKTLVDFEFARKELKQVQDAKLFQELEEAKQTAFKELQRANEEAEKKLNQQRQSFEEQINNLGLSLEQQKELLKNAEKAKKDLEHQKDFLEAELENGRKRRLMEADTSINYSPFKSNFFQDLEDLLNVTVDDDSNHCSNTEGLEQSVGLHDMQVMVKEANSLCKAHEIGFEFHQVQLLSSDSLFEPKVKVCDLKKKQMTYWNYQHFMSFLNSLREYEEGENIKELFDSDSSWETEESQNLVSFGDGSPEKVAFTSCRSSITVETTSITKILNDSISQLSSSLIQEDDSDSEYGTENSTESTPICNKRADRMSIGRGSETTSDSNSSERSSCDTFNDFVEEVQSALCQIEESTEDLLSMFSRIRPGGRRLSNNPILAIEEFESNMHKLKAEILSALESKESLALAVEDGGSSDEASNLMDPVKHDPIATPVKSSLRSPKLENSGSKRVRFYFPE